MPLNLVLNQSEIDRHGRRIARVQRYFEPLHKTAATEPMTGFRRRRYRRWCRAGLSRRTV